MGSINISLRKDAYDFLKSLRGKNKSFSDTILDLKELESKRKGNKKNIMRFFGALKEKNIDWKEKEKRMKEFRRDFENRIKETSEYMEKERSEE
ncbi:MAG: antitoxin VapB family protein [Candidatus Pacearchaeota archaeon]